MGGDDLALIQRRTQELAQIAARLTTPTPQDGGGGGGTSGGQDEGVVDAEFEEAGGEGRRAS
jgi:hypothetical protein